MAAVYVAAELCSFYFLFVTGCRLFLKLPGFLFIHQT